jgi:hypothetical protein
MSFTSCCKYIDSNMFQYRELICMLLYQNESHFTIVHNLQIVTPWSLYFVFLSYVWVGQGVTWVYMLCFVLGFVLFGIAAD